MARKRSTPKKKPPLPQPAPPPAPGQPKSYMSRWREREASGMESEKWGKLELALGRFAQVAGLCAGFVLGFTAFIALNLNGPTPPVFFVHKDMALWMPLIITSFMVSGFTLARKMGPFRSGFRSSHFLSAVVAFAVSIAILLLALMDQYLVLDLSPISTWMYALSILGLSLAFVSLALTWEGHGWRKAASISASVAVPVSLVIVMPFTGVNYYPLLMLTFTYDALLFVFAGSMLHLISSAGEASQRQILKASDSRIGTLKTEMEAKLQALAYKERAYVDRESHLESKERDLLEIERELDGRTKELNVVQGKLDTQGKTLRDLETKLAKMRAETEGKVEEFGLKDKDLRVARGQVEQARQSISEREASLGEREKELKRQQIEVTSKGRAIQAKTTELTDLESRLKKEDASIDKRRDDVIRKEKELQLKGSEIKLKIEQLEAQQSTGVKSKNRELRDWESKVLAKEREVAQLEITLRSTQEEFKQRQIDGDAYAAALAAERERLEAREQELNNREKGISDSDSGISDKVAEIDRRWKEVIETQKRLEAREKEYTTLFKENKLREADFSSTKEEVSRRMAAFEAREQKMKEWQANLGGETKKLQEKFREVLAKEKLLQQKESDASIKELELANRERDAARAPPPSGAKDVDREQYFEMWESRMKEREEEFKRRMYQKEKELEARDAALKEQVRAAAAAGPLGGEVLEAPVQVAADRGDKLRTGTPRLDDLLYGGFSMNANILFVGPAFVGKEVGILNFIGEGLRTNVPAVILTTSKPPVEIAKEMAPVLPTFMEYEQLGLVRWIDASGTTPTNKMTKDGMTYRVPNATDFDGILAALNSAEEDFRERGAQYFRFAFLTLSSSFSQADEKVAIGFVQRFANRLRQSKCVAAFALERGMHTDQQVESLQQLMDGALIFKQDKSKTLMSVVGLGEVQTRDWVPYKFTNKALMIGSFQLERIR